jgi:hypothetical protein
MVNRGFRRLSEKLAMVVKVVTQAACVKRARSFNNRFSNQVCSDIGSEYEQLYVILISGVCHEETPLN